MLTELSGKNFSKFRNSLLSYSKRFNISFEDAEEIVNDSILKALDFFDNERGSFEGLCKVILKRKIINFKRDNVHLMLLIFIDENENIFKADEKSIEEKENNILALSFLNRLDDKLSEAESKLLKEIYKTCESLNKISVSKASINIGLEPLKGWDIFRKIQRKANVLQSSLIKEGKEFSFIRVRNDSALLFRQSSRNEESEDIKLFQKNTSDEISNDQNFVMESYVIYNAYSYLNPSQIEKLNSIYNFSPK